MGQSETDVYEISTSGWNEDVLAKLAAINLDTVSIESNREINDKTGRWGELFVYNILKEKYASEIENGSVSVEWTNEINETGEPYDLKIVFYSTADQQDNNKTTREEYIEVKSTIHSNKESFPISLNELMFAKKKADSYKIYRIYNAFSNSPSYKIIYNLSTQLQAHTINIFMII